MSKRYPGGLITKTPVTPTPSSAPGIWTLEQQLQAQQSGTWPYGGPFNYIEDVFSTYLYTGTGAAQTITNNINLSGNGGLVWTKDRSSATYSHFLQDTNRGAGNQVTSSSTNAQVNSPTTLTSFNSNGYTLGTAAGFNIASDNFVSWTFRKQPKFFDVVTYTGTGTDPMTISHNLQSVPGCIIIKCTSSVSNWRVHSTALDMTLVLNLTNAGSTPDGLIKNLTSTTFQVNNSTDVNNAGLTYVAYLFAHNAGGFGLTGSDNVISCGSCTGGNGTTVNLGYEPQWLLLKKTNDVQNWFLMDNMRGLNSNQGEQALSPNLPNAEPTASSNFNITSTGFTNKGLGTTSDTYIYIAIRRGPMKVPTVGTSVFYPDYNASFPQPGVVTTGFVADFDIYKRTGGSSTIGGSRLTGGNYLFLNDTSAETAGSNFLWGSNTELTVQSMAASGNATINWAFRRVPGFFDEVCYTGTGSATTQTHNLGAVPELMILKGRSGATAWQVYSSALANTEYLVLNTTAAKATGATRWNSTTPTSSVFSIGTATEVNTSSATYFAYLFATCPGVSKVGSYSGTGATQTIDCGFTGGARFVLIKRTDSTGDWYVWDTARGMVAGTDPSLLLNTTAAEVNANSVYTTGVGFQIVSTAAGINASGGTYIFLAVA